MMTFPQPSSLPVGAGVRPAEVKDAEGIAYIHITAWQETYRGLVPDSVLDTLSIERRAQQWKDSLDDPTDVYHAAIVAEMNGRIVGFANYGKEREGVAEYQGELFAIYVLKDFHGRGIGKSLLCGTAAGLLALDISSMLVWVLAENPARKFYERMGGKYVREKSVQIGGSTLLECAYGWRELLPLVRSQGAE